MSVVSFSTSSPRDPSKARDVIIVDNKPEPKKVLEEEEYLGRMAKIIRRDFFSDIEFPNGPDSQTPAYSSTERSNISQQTTPSTERTQFSTTSSVRSRHDACSLGLNEYLEKYTSEDNAYFEKLQKKELKRHRLKYPWLYRDKSNHNKKIQDQLKLPSMLEQAKLNETNSSTKMIDWPHNPRNSLFYPPDESNRGKTSSTINYRSSKYMNEPIFKEPLPARDSQPKVRSFKGFSDKIGIDGKLLNGSETPIINGYSFIPVPETPGPSTVEEKRLKTDLNKFYIPNESPRDELAHRVYQEKVAKVIRTPKTGPPGTPLKSTPSFRKGYADFSFSPERVKTPKWRNKQ